MSDLRDRLSSALDDPAYRHAYAAEFLDMVVARQIRALRKQRGWSQAELAQRLGTKQSFVSEIESEDYGSLSINTLKGLAEAFDVYLTVKFESFSKLLAAVETSSMSEIEVAPFEIDRQTWDAKGAFEFVAAPRIDTTAPRFDFEMRASAVIRMNEARSAHSPLLTYSNVA